MLWYRELFFEYPYPSLASLHIKNPVPVHEIPAPLRTPIDVTEFIKNSGIIAIIISSYHSSFQEASVLIFHSAEIADQNTFQ